MIVLIYNQTLHKYYQIKISVQKEIPKKILKSQRNP